MTSAWQIAANLKTKLKIKLQIVESQLIDCSTVCVFCLACLTHLCACSVLFTSTSMRMAQPRSPSAGTGQKRRPLFHFSV